MASIQMPVRINTLCPIDFWMATTLLVSRSSILYCFAFSGGGYRLLKFGKPANSALMSTFTSIDWSHMLGKNVGEPSNSPQI